MASYNELNALIDAYINRNGVQAITGQILNGVLKAMVEQIGRGYAIMGVADPTTDPWTPDAPESWFAYEPGTYTLFDEITVAPGEFVLLEYRPNIGWRKETLYDGFQTVQASIDGSVGTPSVGVSYANGVLSFDFHNMKGNPGEPGDDGDPAGFGTIGADITGGVGTPGVSVESSGPATAKNLQFHFTNLKGETGVTSVVVTVDNTTGTPTCTASLSGGVLTLAFTGLKGAQGNPGSSVDYPFTLVNNLTTDDPDQALTAAMGVQLESEISQLEAEVDDLEDGLVLSDTIRKETTDVSYLSGVNINSSSQITSSSGKRLYYFPVKNGQKVTAYYSISANYAVVGFSTSVPAVGGSVTNYSSGNSTTTQKSITAPSDGYFCFAVTAASLVSVYFLLDNLGFGKSVNDAIVTLTERVDPLENALNPSKKEIDISTRQAKLKGYANADGKFINIGTASYYFIYVPVESGKTYRFKGTYDISNSTYADILFSATIPESDDYGVVLDANKATGTNFDITFTAPSDGFVFIWARSTDVFYDSFYEKESISEIDGLKKDNANIKEAIDYSETNSPITEIQSVKGYVLASGKFVKIADESSAITMRYFPVAAGKKYRITGTHASQSAYGSIIFTESFPVEGDFGIIIKMSDAGNTFDVAYTADLDGYIFIYASYFSAFEIVPEQKLMQHSDIFSECEAEQIKLVGVAYQAKYITVSTHKVVDASVNGSFIIAVSAGEKYFIRANVHAYTSYAVVGFTTDLTNGYTGARILKSVSEEDSFYTYTYEFLAEQNGYLVVWSTISGYGSKNYVEIFRMRERQTEIQDYYLPESVKIQTFGDSITDNNWGDYSSWVSYAPDNIKNTELTIINSAVGGASIGGTGSYNIPHQVTDGYTRDDGSVASPLDATADLVVIFAGTNDWSAGQSLASTLGNLASTFQYIFEHSKARVLFCTPLQRYNDTDQARDTDADGVPMNSLGLTLRDECDELIKVCKRFSVPVLDLNADANINRYNILDYSSDGLHPQRWGDAYVSRLICKKIKEMLRG